MNNIHGQLDKIIAMNVGNPDSMKGCSIKCATIDCDSCPMNHDSSTTLGDIRKHVNPTPATLPVGTRVRYDAKSLSIVPGVQALHGAHGTITKAFPQNPAEYEVLWDGHEKACRHLSDFLVVSNQADMQSEPEVEPKAPAPADDSVRKPSHYQVFDGLESIEVIARSMTVSEFRGFCMGNVLKYRLRAGKKSELATMEKDLNKAAFYSELFEQHKGKCYDSE
ncbi:nucleotide kinase [Enterobacter phage EcpYZU01]|uniref:nucleotide kinase n=1 Tax=Enterobacter phage EcpYZU01 TaxID=2483604 RepID=UPI0018AC9166|nr:nucleotide kinase [Enterobacter phage EcpYZU01]